ncbi:MAG: hypothetical protein DMF24_11730 [Verrucomicrobia bacterium]|nr:MAG: hypothetical protein DMF24_11730 [Verrucomicrobiota bacterium]
MANLSSRQFLRRLGSRRSLNYDQRMKLKNCSALITGASSGIGREFARQLANRARKIVLVARRSERLADLRDELLNRNPNLDVHVRVADLADRCRCLNQ